MSVLGLDIGTSGCKAVVYSAEGEVLASAAREYALRHPKPGWAELDAEEVWRHCAACIRECAARAGSPVQALSFCSQGEAIVAVDAQGVALSPAMVSSDIRAADLVTAAVRVHGADFFYQRGGHTPHPLFSLFKLLWLRDHQPRVWRSAWKFLCFEDFAQRKLGLDPAISWSMAGRTLLFNPRTHTWNAELLALAGLSPERLSRPLPSGEVAGEVSAPIARDLGLAPGCRVVTGGHDQVAAALGAGVAAPGQALYAMGSVECMVVVSDRFFLAEGLRDANLCSYDHTVASCYAHLAYNLTGSNLISWFREQFAAEVKPETGSVYEWMFARIPPAPAGLLVLPYFTTSGTPYFDPRARGAIVGLEFHHSRFDILRALVEGLAFEMRLNLELLAAQGIPVRHFRATGGGTRSRAALQIKADVLQTAITPTLNSEGGCLATALIAQAALDQRPVQDYLSQWVKLGETVQPDPATREVYEEAYGRYRQLYPALKPLLRP
jgi:xylulokinase